jgi:hypothetical protein
MEPGAVVTITNSPKLNGSWVVKLQGIFLNNTYLLNKPFVETTEEEKDAAFWTGTGVVEMDIENLTDTVSHAGTIDTIIDATVAGFPGAVIAQGETADVHLDSVIGQNVRFANWTYGGSGPDYSYLSNQQVKVLGLAGVYPLNYMILDIPYQGSTWADVGGGVDFNYSYVEKLEKENISSASLIKEASSAELFNVESGQEEYLYTLNKTGTKWNLNTNKWNKGFGNFPTIEN